MEEVVPPRLLPRSPSSTLQSVCSGRVVLWILVRRLKLLRATTGVKSTQMCNMCLNPLPPHTHAHTHIPATQRITHTQTPLCPHYERGLCRGCVCYVCAVPEKSGDEEKGVNKDREKVKQSVRRNE